MATTILAHFMWFKIFRQFVGRLTGIFSNNRLIPESIYALELQAKLYFGQDTDLDRFILSSDIEAKKAAFNIMKNFADIRV